MQEYQRKPTRRKDWDYTTPGLYFVTIVVHQHACLLGEIINDEMILSPAGKIVRQTWLELPSHYPYIRVEPFIIMPNHIHGIIELIEPPEISGDRFTAHRRGGFRNPPLQDKPAKRFSSSHHGLSKIVRGFKTWSARQINEYHNSTGVAFWQRSFYDSIIRNERHLRNVETYIMENPRRWKEDSENW